jgi:hypothetical protein
MRSITALVLTGVVVSVMTVKQPAGLERPGIQTTYVTGTVSQYLLTPHGDIDGFLMTDDTQVHFPPHLERNLLAVARPHSEVQVQGYRAEGVPFMDALTITNPETNHAVTEREPSWRDRPVLPPGAITSRLAPSRRHKVWASPSAMRPLATSSRAGGMRLPLGS